MQGWVPPLSSDQARWLRGHIHLYVKFSPRTQTTNYKRTLTRILDNRVKKSQEPGQHSRAQSPCILPAATDRPPRIPGWSGWGRLRARPTPRRCGFGCSNLRDAKAWCPTTRASACMCLEGMCVRARVCVCVRVCGFWIIKSITRPHIGGRKTLTTQPTY